MTATVSCRGLTRRYRQGAVEVTALDGLDLDVAPGEFLCLSGPSGSGKTTLLNLVGGLDRPTGGTVTVAGRRLDRMGPAELAEMRLRHIGFVFQAYNLVPVLSAVENVEFVMLLQGVGRREARRRAAEILAEVGLSGLEDRRPGELSGGQQQRVAVARAIVTNPDLVLADEPTANLDSATAEALMRLLQRMNRERGVTLVVATHDPRVMEHARRLVTLTDGRIVADRRVE
ncbi:ABC transporter ATP-binding protein [Dissulfurirhabdus thermomarina]|uniref:ABC transporter ATP-binding protein n=1 Tax=Dissulfurirhabdus thermomarina TaxID=1765737 RepID=A0A6N9TT48_DISTH|nr:ABC transporter ATP-binding protein [Dissulfurirhabdus thermomarina]NDY42617.1 ABC transporter ATP-binding protein [Dissulfurirhabdus thermomarina]NMX24074.1 ABC transporter ATP-binding protein [Dissulfurirhabdus thermomarina]